MSLFLHRICRFSTIAHSDLVLALERPGLDKIQRHHLNGDSMKTVLQTLLLVLFALPLAAQGAPPQNAADQPYVMEYYYKVQWGTSAGISPALPQEPLSPAPQRGRERAHAVGKD
jgi:hypothetical protein